MSNVRKNVVRTMFNSMLSLRQSFGLNYEPIINTTLNELYNTDNDVVNSDYKIGHFIVGLASEDIYNNNALDLSLVEHQPYDANVIVPIPLLMVPTTEELTSLERSTYKLFTTKTYGGVNYHVAYAKSINAPDTRSVPLFITHDNTNGYGVSSLESKNIPYLSPTTTRETVAYPNELQFVAHDVGVGISLSSQEITKIKSYIDIIYPSRTGVNKYDIGNICLIHSQHDSRSDSREISNAQTAYFINVVPKDLVKDNLDITISIGDFMPIHGEG